MKTDRQIHTPKTILVDVIHKPHTEYQVKQRVEPEVSRYYSSTSLGIPHNKANSNMKRSPKHMISIDYMT